MASWLVRRREQTDGHIQRTLGDSKGGRHPRSRPGAMLIPVSGPGGMLSSHATLSPVQFRHSVMSDSLRTVDCSTPGFPVHHQFPELTQTHAKGGALLQEAGLSDTIPTTPFTGSPFCRLSAWVDSPVVWALPASAPESGFLLGPESAPLFSALTTWTNPELINHLCCSHLSCSTGIFCFSGCYYDPGPNHASLVLCYKACPHSDPPTVPNWEPPCA